jgi:hypothetical protein
MSIDFSATYRDGVLYPDAPLHLPNNTTLEVRAVPKSETSLPDPFPTTREEILAIRPKSPPFTAEKLDELIEKYSVSVGSLPEDFSRADIYSDHD